MACSSCKQKNNFKEDITKTTEFINKGVIWFVVIWSIFAVYGIYSLIQKFL